MRYFGKIGFEHTVTREDDSGVDLEIPIERPYYGDVLSANRRLESSTDGVNDNLTVSNRISIVADAFAEENFYSIRYAQFHGKLWKVANVEVERPRLVLTLGGVYNGLTPATPR